MSERPLPTDDGALVAAFRSGHAAAFDAIVARHYGRMLRVAEMRCGNGAIADDAVQTALVRVHRYLRGKGPVDNLGAWLRRVVHNCATDLLRLEGRERANVELRDQLAVDGTGELERKELRQIIQEAIACLPAIYREPLTLRYLHGIEAREIAQQLKDNINSVKSRIARGRRELRRRIEGALRRSGYL